MKNLKSYEQYLNEDVPHYIGVHQVDSPADTVINVLGEEQEEYMFFQNLKTIKSAVDHMLKMDSEFVNTTLRDGHAWAIDHIATSKDDIEEVHGFLMGKSKSPSMNEAKMSDFHRILAMSPTWWEAWKIENKDAGFEVKTDAFSKTHEVSKDGKVLFVFDYGRNKIFTNEDPQTFILKNDITPDELEKLKDKAEGDIVPKPAEDKEESSTEEKPKETEEE